MTKSERWGIRLLQLAVVEIGVYALWVSRRLDKLEDEFIHHTYDTSHRLGLYNKESE